MSDTLQMPVGEGAGVVGNKVRGVIKDKKIILANDLMGYLDGEFEVEIIDGMAARRASNSENLISERRRRTTKNYIKLKRDHSV